jgi:hypothetical protein
MARLDDLTEIVTETRSQMDQILKTSQKSTPNIGCPSTNTSPNAASAPHLGAEESLDPLGDSPKTEYEGESSLFGHAQFAATFLQNAIGGNSASEVRGEMTLVLETLHDIVKSQKQKSDSLGSVFPHARLLPYSSDLRDLPFPPMEKIFGCLRMAQGTYRNFWGGVKVTDRNCMNRGSLRSRNVDIRVSKFGPVHALPDSDVFPRPAN